MTARINVAPLMMLVVLAMLAGMWIDSRHHVTSGPRLAGDIAIAVGIMILLPLSFRTPGLRLRDVSRSIRFWLLLALTAGTLVVAAAFSHWLNRV